MSMVTYYQMPTSEYSFLSETQREYLNNPDDFDSQRSAELSYRIRQKYKSVKSDIELLHESPEVWDKMTDGMPVTLKCKFRSDRGPENFGACQNTVDVDPIRQVGELSEESIERELDNGWVSIEDMRTGDTERRHWSGVCPSCHDKAREYARERGTVPCSGFNCTAHKPDSDPFNECYGNLALTDDDMRDIDAVDTPLKVSGLEISFE